MKLDACLMVVAVSVINGVIYGAMAILVALITGLVPWWVGGIMGFVPATVLTIIALVFIQITGD